MSDSQITNDQSRIAGSGDEPRLTNHELREEDEISLLDLAIVIAKHKLLVVGLPFVVAIGAAIISLLLPEKYTATTRILPPQQSQSSATAMIGQLGALAGGAAGALGIKNPVDLYVGMLKSRTIADRLIERFKLQQVYELKRLSDVREKLQNVSKIAAGKEGLITIDVEDHDPVRAAAVANAYVDELLKLTSTLAVTEAGQRRVFFERQLDQAKNNLLQAELAARGALEHGGIAMVDAQGKSMVETSALLRAQIAAKEVEINSMQSFAAQGNPALSKARQELAALRQQIMKIETGDNVSSSGMRSGTKEQGVKNLTLLRDVKYNEFLFELLGKQYELARIDEAKEGAVIQVVDKAIQPDRRSSPKRMLIVLLSALAAGMVALLLAFMREALHNARRNPETSQRFATLHQYLAWRRK